MKKNILILLLILPSILTAQDYKISGLVSNNSGNKLIEANIQTNKKSVLTDKVGHYSLSTNQNKLKLSVSYIGYKTQTVSIEINNDTTINFILQKKENQIGEVQVVSERDFEKAISETKITSNIINTLPALGGEKDIIKALLFIPGVQAGSEATTGFFVRGGNSDQNLILMDNIPIYNVSHLFGYMSVFDVDMTEGITLIKAGYPASYGGRLSSLVKIDLKNGKSKKTTGKFTLGLVSSKLQLEIPLKKNTYLLISGRKTYFDLFTRYYNTSIKQNEGSNTYLSFYDFNLRLTSKLYEKNKIFFNFYTGDDKTEFANVYKIEGSKSSDIFKNKTGNIVSSLSYKHYFNKRNSLNLVTGFTRYRNIKISESEMVNKTNPEKNESEFFGESSSILDYKNILKYQFSNNFLNTEAGTEFINHNYIPFSVSYNKNVLPIYETYKPFEFAVFVDNKLKIKKFIINTGLRYTQYHIKKSKYNYLEPRISVKYTITKSISIKGSYTIMHQYNHLLSNLSTGTPADIWFPVTETSSPMRAEQYTVGISKTKLFGFINTGVEIYYKKTSNLIDFSDNVLSDLDIVNIEDYIITNGKGESYGLELFAQFNKDKYNGGFSYTLSKTDRQFEQINDGKPYPFKYDRRHNLSSYIAYDISKKIKLSTSWTYMTGYALTLPIGRYYSPASENEASLFLYSNRNQFRMPSYHRLDLAIKFEKQKARGLRTWEISIYNAYNRQNAFFIEIHSEFRYNDKTQDFELSKPKFWQRSLLPIIPSISYSFKF